MKIAKLVYASFVVRVVVDESTTEEDIIQQSRQKFIDTINNGLGDHIEDIEDDTECPYNPERD